jgi:ABC-type phosphate transport system substrate-binding protein
MTKLTRLIAAAAAVVTATLVAGPALADPPSGVVPKPTDIVGVGSSTLEYLFDQYSHDYDATVSAKAPHLYSFDATNPVTGATDDPITTKQGCKPIPRPDGSSPGITALTTENGTTSGRPCIDFARSDRGREPSDPPYAPGGVAFIYLMGKVVTWAHPKTSDAPDNLTAAQLTEIYNCQVTNWDQVGGKNAPIKAFIPQVGSETRSEFLIALDITEPGPCVSDLATKADPDGTLQQDQGITHALHNPATILPYQTSSYLAQWYHSAKCFNPSCTPNSSGQVCAPKGSQNLFGCDTHGPMVLNEINGTAPTIPFPLTNATKKAKTNPAFPAAFVFPMYDVAPYSTASGSVNHIPPNLVGLFGPKGWICTSKTAKTDVFDYGFFFLHTCGTTY